MFVHRVFAPLKRVLPRWLSGPLRNVLTAVLTPVHFSYFTGHFRSSLRARAVSRRGEALPWYSYAAIDFLSFQSYEGRSVLEFGAGQSTLWWARRAKAVLALESDPRWLSYLRARVPQNAEVVLAREDLAGAEELLHGRGAFDLIAIDGLDRIAAARLAPPRLRAGGAIVLDNSDCPWSSDGRYGIIEFLQAEGFRRIDFYGYSPGNIVPQCTSIFFRQDCFLLRNPSPPVRLAT